VSDSSADTFSVHNRGEIMAILEQLGRERALIAIEFGDGHAIVSSVLALRPETRTMIVDIARDEERTRRMFAAQRLSFEAELDHIRIAFQTRAPSLVSFFDGPAAAVDIPTAVTRLQRREWFRVPLPDGLPIRCTVLDREGNACPAHAVDLSCGGAGLVVDIDPRGLGEPGSVHELILSLPEVGRLELDAKLRSVAPALPGRDGELPKVRAGFRFESVPPKTTTQIQRFVNRVEVMRRKR
jgi:c-di-GMP-binding flagellar brake protein YcgR